MEAPIHVKLIDRRTISVSCQDKDILDLLQEMMDGSKIRGVNTILTPIKSASKLLTRKKALVADDKVMGIINRVDQNIRQRVSMINSIKSQYKGKIDFTYETKGKFKPMEHQKIMYNMLYYPDVSAVLAEPGTCKTGPYLWAIDKRIRDGNVRKVLIITLSSLKRNVLAEMELQVPHLSGVVLSKKAQTENVLNKTFKNKKRNRDYDIYICNYESIYSIAEMVSDDYFQMVILDEAHRIGAPNSRQTRAIIDNFQYVPYKHIITGTLNSNNCTSFFMPFRFLGPDTLPVANFYGFRKRYMYTVDPNGHIWKEISGTRTIVKNIIGRLSVFFSKDECLDLPGIIYTQHYCDIAGDQKKHYDNLKKDYITILNDMCKQCTSYKTCKGKNRCDNSLVIKNALTAVTKLQQIACGFYINTRTEVTSDGKEVDRSNIIEFNSNSKLNLLMDTINNIPPDKKIIIWTNYTHAIEVIKSRLAKAGLGNYLTAYGNDNAFQQIELFKDPKYRFLIANPTKAGAGLNIQFSNYQIFFSNNFSFINRDQAEGRQYRKGQTEKVTVIDLMCEKTVDTYIYKALRDKKDLSTELVGAATVIK